MTIKKNGSDRRSKDIEDRKTTWLKSEDAVRAIQDLIRSMKMNAEQKISLDDGINNLSKEVESMMNRIDMAPSTTEQKNLLSAYRKFLQQQIAVVNQRLKKKD
ncbi:MAG: hypothetical protein ACJ71D_03110 [Nitrososphaera sp.]